MNSGGMSLDAVTFSISRDDRAIGLAVLSCPARYLSVRWSDSPDIARCSPTSDQWKAIATERTDGLPTPLPARGAISSLLAKSTRDRVDWLHVQPLKVEGPISIVATLDAFLNAQAGALAPRADA